MSTIAIVMMLLFTAVIWGGLLLTLTNLMRSAETTAARQLISGEYTPEH